MSFGASKTIRFLRYNGRSLSSQNMITLARIIFTHFLQLEDVKGVDHSFESVYDKLISPQSVVVLAVNNQSIIGYVIAEPTLYDMQNLLHIYYIYVIPSFRNKGVATRLLKMVENYAHWIGINRISLTYDTYNDNLTKFYRDNHFDFDDTIRSFQRYDMLVKHV